MPLSGSVGLFQHSTFFKSTQLECVGSPWTRSPARGDVRGVNVHWKVYLKRSPRCSDISVNPGPLFTTHISGGRWRGQWGPRWWWRTRRRSWLGRFPGRSSGTSYPVWNERSRSFWSVVLQHDALGLLTHLGTEGGAGSWAQVAFLVVPTVRWQKTLQSHDDAFSKLFSSPEGMSSDFRCERNYRIKHFTVQSNRFNWLQNDPANSFMRHHNK